MIKAAEKQAFADYGEDVPIAEHARIRSAEACWKSSSLAVSLAQQHGTRLHILHLSTARELELFEPGPIDAKRITAEVCVHHLWFDQSDYAELGTRIKCNPAIKTAEDRIGLLAGVNADIIDVIATDHAPHTLDEKRRKYFEAPAGLPLVQHSLLMLLEQHRRGAFSLETIVQKTAHNPATLFGIEARGFIREGYFADMVVVNLDGQTTVTSEQVQYKCGWSPLEGQTLRGSVQTTILNGRVVFDHGNVVEQPAGRQLEFSAAY
jgi:dihydroorotase